MKTSRKYSMDLLLYSTKVSRCYSCSILRKTFWVSFRYMACDNMAAYMAPDYHLIFSKRHRSCTNSIFSTGISRKCFLDLHLSNIEVSRHHFCLILNKTFCGPFRWLWQHNDQYGGQHGDRIPLQIFKTSQLPYQFEFFNEDFGKILPRPAPNHILNVWQRQTNSLSCAASENT